MKPVCAPVCAPCEEAAPAACAPCEEAAPTCAAPCEEVCNPCTPCCAPCRPLLSLFRQVNCDLKVAACTLDYDLQMAHYNMQMLRCNMKANIEQCKAEADAREACRVAARSGACGDVEVCIPNRCRPGAAIKGIFRTLFGTPSACGCDIAPACGCEAAEPACAPAEVAPVTACAPEEVAPVTGCAPEEVPEMKEPATESPAPAVQEEKEDGIDASILPEADPTSVSGNFYNPSRSIVLR